MIRHKLLPMNLQFFADEGTSVTDMDGLDAFLAGMDSGDEESSDTEEEQDTAEEEVEEAEPEKEETPPDKQKPSKTAQQDYTFAQMRAQNNQLKAMLSKLAKANGIEYQNENDLLTKLNDDAINKLAQKQNLPPELLKRMEMLEQHSLLYQQEQLKQQAFIGFQRVKDEFKLSEAELRSFAQELDEKGKNPFTTQVDLIAEYKVNHFDDIVDRKVKEAVATALKTSSAADKHSSTPSSKNGKSDGGSTEKITTIAGLDAFLKNVK